MFNLLPPPLVFGVALYSVYMNIYVNYMRRLGYIL